MAEKQSSTDVLPLNNQERYVEQCRGVLDRKEELRSMYNDLEPYPEVCAGLQCRLSQNSTCTFEELPAKKKDARAKIEAALQRLDELDTEIATAAKIPFTGYDKAENGAVMEMREILQRLLSTLRETDVTKFPPGSFTYRHCRKAADEFYYSKDGDSGFNTRVNSQVLKSDNSTSSSSIDNANLPAVKSLIKNQGPGVLSAAIAVDELLSALEDIRTLASAKRSKEFQEKIPVMLNIINEGIARDGLTTETRKREDIATPINGLIAFVSKEIVHRAKDKFWTSADFKEQIDSNLRDIQKCFTQYDQGTVVQEARKQRQAQLPETGADDQQRRTRETVQGDRSGIGALVGKILPSWLRRR